MLSFNKTSLHHSSNGYGTANPYSTNDTLGTNEIITISQIRMNSVNNFVFHRHKVGLRAVTVTRSSVRKGQNVI